MNRLEHLASTLPQNLLDNQEYPSTDFVILNYNSKDELEKYILHTFRTEIQSGRISYFRTAQPNYFDRSHSRNVAFRLAQGDILCNLDSDNFTGNGFAAYLNNLFCASPDIFVCAPPVDNIAGRIAMRKQDYLATRGYDERMKCYGYEDYDMVYRLEMNGLKKVIINDARFMRAIDHPQSKRIENEYIKTHLLDLYIRHITPSISEAIILLKDNHFLTGPLIDYNTLEAEINSGRSAPLREYIEPNFDEGSCCRTKQGLQLLMPGSDVIQLEFGPGEDILRGPNQKIFYRLSGKEEMINECIQFFSQQFNRSILDGKKSSLPAIINSNGFGSTMVFKNYDQNTGISI